MASEHDATRTQLQEAPTERGQDGPGGTTRSRRLPSGRVWLVGSILALEIALWILVFGVAGLFREGPNGKGMGTDFAVFSGAASAMKHGENPYDYRVLYRSERALLKRQHLPVTSNELNVRAGNPPLFYWALEPLTSLPFQRVAIAWIIGMYLASLAGLLLTLRYMRWSAWVAPVMVFMLMPQVVTGAVYGNVHGPVFAAVALALLLADRHPAAAGAVAALGWLKPQLALPLMLLIFLFETRSWQRFAGGFAAVSTGLFAATLTTTGLQSLGDWIAGLNSWSKGIAREPNIASLSGLYAAWAPRPLQIAIGAGLLAAAAILTLAAWRRFRRERPLPLARVGWLWAVWFLASPFTHFPDEIVLTAPFLVLLGRDGSLLPQRRASFGLCLAFFSLLLFPSPLVSLSIIALAVLLWQASHDPIASPSGSSDLALTPP